MRISDWSSDVCSSDLSWARRGRSCSAYRQVGGQREGQGRQAGTSRGGRSCRDASRYDRSRKESGTRCALCSAEESEVVQMILKGHPWSPGYFSTGLRSPATALTCPCFHGFQHWPLLL